MSEQIEFVKEIARRLDSAGIEYMLTGSIAMVFYATPRMTRDIDLLNSVPELDRDYLSYWANQLGASVYLAKAMTNE